MPAPPLTHHEILGRVEPFSRSGWQVDLAATDRVARRIAFRPRVHEQPPVREQLHLDSLGTGSFKLTRTVTLADEAAATPGAPGPLQGTLLASGDDPAALLAAFDRVPLARHLDRVDGVAILRSYQYESFLRGPSFDATSALLLRHAESRFDGLQLALDLSMVRGVSAEITLTPLGGGTLALPQDLLAVIGWDWARLIRKKDAWTTRHRLRGNGPRRTAGAEQALRVAVQHLRRVLAEPPAAFHPQHRLARWGVVLRRSIPSLTALGMIGGVFLLPRLAPNQDPGVWLALHYAPIALLAVAFGLQELPQFEIPPLPRPLREPGWHLPGPAPAG